MRYNVVHNPTNTVISFGLLIAVVGSSFAYVYYNTPELGFDGRLLSPNAARVLGIEHEEGILVTKVVPGGPADMAGLKGGTRAITVGDQVIMVGGDIITAIDGMPIKTRSDYVAATDKKSIGDSVRMTIIRDGKTQEIDIIVGRQS